MGSSDPNPDFSARAVKRAVLSASGQHPSVVYPAALAILGGLGAAAFVGPTLAVGAALVGGSIAAGAWVANYLWRHEAFASRYLEAAHRALVEQRAKAIAELKESLGGLKANEGMQQLDRFGDKLATFEAILGEKFRPSELTFGRFLGIAEQVYLAGTDNLRGIGTTLRAAEAIDDKYIRRRIKALEDDPATSPAETAEIEGLNRQLEVLAGHRRRVDEYLAANEKALAQLDASIAALAEIRTGGGAAGVDMETAMQELARVAAQAKTYSTE